MSGGDGEGEPTGAGILRRHFVAIATADYDDPAWPRLPVEAEVAVARDWLCAEGLGERRFHQRFPELAESPTKRAIRDALEDPRDEDRWRAADAAFLFVTGHGLVDRDEHHLVLRETDAARPSTAFVSAELIRWLLDTGIEHLVVVVDTCYAGALGADLARRRLRLPASWLVLLGSGSDEEAAPGALTGAITAFLDELVSREGERYGHEPYLTVERFLEGVQGKLGRGQTLNPVTGPARSAPHHCLPNPHHRADPQVTVEPSRHDLAVYLQDLRTHWGPKSRGVAGDEPGWLFTGRATLMRTLIDAATGPAGVTVVTGGAGTGKSAVLARLVTLSDPEFRRAHADQLGPVPPELDPPAGAVDAAVIATGMLPVELLDRVLRALGVPVRTEERADPGVAGRLAAWHRWLDTRDRPVTLVVDAVDEAAQPRALIRNVLNCLDPDPQHPRLRLVVGVRSPGGADDLAGDPVRTGPPLAGLLDRASRVTVDEPPWWEPANVIAYAASILRNTPGSPYRALPDAEIDAVAAEVGGAAGPSYLTARIAATSLAHGGAAVTAGDRAWREALERGVVGVFARDLRDSLPEPDDRYRAVVLLRAVAFARGPGLPWHRIWPRVANAVDGGGRSYGDRDIGWLLDSRLGGYLVTDRVDRTTVYRLFHDLLRDLLRERWAELLPDEPVSAEPVAAVEARIAAELAELARPTPTGQPPDDYVRRHAVAHAAAGGVLDSRFLSPGFLPYVDAARLRELTADGSVHRGRLVHAWRQVAHAWRWDDPARNRDALHFQLRLAGAGHRDAAPSAAGWRVRWLRWPTGRGEIVARHTGPIRAVATAELPGGRAVAVAGGDDGTVGVWDLVSGAPVGEPMAGHGVTVRAVDAAVLRDGRVVAVTGDSGGSVRVWELGTGQPVGAPLAGPGQVTAIGTATLADGRVVAVCRHREGTRAWELETARPLTVPPEVGDRGGDSVATVALDDGRLVAVADGSGGTAHVWDVATGSLVDTIPAGARAIAAWRLGTDRPAVALLSGHPPVDPLDGELLTDTIARVEHDRLRMWDLDAGHQLGGDVPLDEGGSITAMVVATLPKGRTRVLTAGDRLREWDPQRLDRGGRVLDTCGPAVRSVAVWSRPDERAMAVTGGADAAVRIWDLGGDTEPTGRADPRHRVHAIAVARLRGQDVVLHAGGGDQLCIDDLRTGRPVRRIDSGFTTGVVNAVAATVLADGRVIGIAGCGFERPLRAWDLASGHRLGEIDTGHLPGLTGLAVATLPDGRVLAVTAGLFLRGVLLWDLSIGAPAGQLSGSFAAPHVRGAKPRRAGGVEYQIDWANTPGNGCGITAAATATLPGGRPVAVAGADDGTVCAWDIATATATGRLSAHCAVTAIATASHPGGAVAVVGGADGSLRVADLGSVTWRGEPVPAHPDGVAALTAEGLPDGRLIAASGGNDGLVRLWELPSARPLRHRPLGHPLPVNGAVTALHLVPRRTGPQLLVGGDGLACVTLPALGPAG